MKAIIEIPKGSFIKYEICKETGIMLADRVLQIPYTHNYGYIEDTLAEDGDPLDIFVITSQGYIESGARTEFRTVGIVYYTDNKEVDNKIIAVHPNDKVFDFIDDINDLKEDHIYNIKKFLASYKDNTSIEGVGDKKSAMREITKCLAAYKKTQWSPDEK